MRAGGPNKDGLILYTGKKTAKKRSLPWKQQYQAGRMKVRLLRLFPLKAVTTHSLKPGMKI